MMEGILLGLDRVLQPDNLIMIPLGLIVGTIIGAFPGMGASFAIIIMIPLTYWMRPEQALIFLTNVGGSAEFGGSIPAILMHVPGTPGSTATCWDGYPMTKKGEAARALGISLFASGMGGLFGAIILLLLSPPIASFALKFSYPEMFLIALLGITLIGSATGKLVKAFLAGCLGLLVATIGSDPISAVPRFTFGIVDLYDGIHFVVALIGLFGFSEMLFLLKRKHIVSSESAFKGTFKDLLVGVKDVIKRPLLFLRVSSMGTVLGATPGIGPAITNIVAYNMAVSSSKEPHKFGTGIPEGVLAPEATNNATQAGALIPAFTLGIPGSGMTAALLGGLMLHGLVPGPMLFKNQPEVVYSVMLAFLIGNPLMILLLLSIQKQVVKIVLVPSKILIPVTLLLIIIGAYGIKNSWFDVGLMILFGILGYYMRTYEYPVQAFVLPLILGSIIEEGFRKGLMLGHGDPMIFFTRPLTIALWILIIASIVIPYVIRKKYGKSESKMMDKSGGKDAS
ncbi:MAG: tripartite tricarboxylate transporter permease [Nitrospirota bacterium]